MTGEQIVADMQTRFRSMVAGPPLVGPPMARFTGVGYAALQSGGQTTWAEFDLARGPTR